MKLKLTFKTSDVIDSIKEEVSDIEMVEQIYERLKKYIKYGEYVTLEYDTEKDTMEVCRV